MPGALARLIFVAIVVTIYFKIVSFVYRDSKWRGMNTTLWTLFAVLAPVLGLIVYMYMRGDRMRRY